jgi:hypothetical protein
MGAETLATPHAVHGLSAGDMGTAALPVERIASPILQYLDRYKETCYRKSRFVSTLALAPAPSQILRCKIPPKIQTVVLSLLRRPTRRPLSLESRVGIPNGMSVHTVSAYSNCTAVGLRILPAARVARRAKRCW